MKVTVLSGGVGGAKFLEGLRHHLRTTHPDGEGGTTASIAAICNVGDDIWINGLRITPDLDSVMYTLAGENDTERGWGRKQESQRVSSELKAYGMQAPWFTLGDLDIGTHIARTSLLASGMPLSAVVDKICERWKIGVRLLPATDQPVETFVHTTEHPPMHFQEWWVRHRAEVAALGFEQRGVDRAVPAPGVLEAIADCDYLIVAPSNPVVSIGTILGIPQIRTAIENTAAVVVGISPIISGNVVRGMADHCLAAIGVASSAEAVALHYGARRNGGILDRWLVDTEDLRCLPTLRLSGLSAWAVPLWMTDIDLATNLASTSLLVNSPNTV